MNLPPLPYPQSPGNDYTAAQMQAYATAAIMQADPDAEKLREMLIVASAKCITLQARCDSLTKENTNVRRANRDCVDNFNQLKQDYDAAMEQSK